MKKGQFHPLMITGKLTIVTRSVTEEKCTVSVPFIFTGNGRKNLNRCRILKVNVLL